MRPTLTVAAPWLVATMFAFMSTGLQAADDAPEGEASGASPAAAAPAAGEVPASEAPAATPSASEPAGAAAAPAKPAAAAPASAATPAKTAILAPAAPKEPVEPLMMPADHPIGAADRPFRMGFMQLSQRDDREKPLAALDPGGFVINSGVLVGQVDGNWVGGMSMTTRKWQWWYDGKVTMTAPPGSFGSSVVLGFRDGKVVKVDALTGKKLWTATLDSFTERPLLLNGTTLYVLTAAQVLYALDFQSGKTLWLFDAGFPEGLTIRGGAKPVFHDGKVLIGVASGEIIGVAADTGKLLWRYNPAYNDARFHDVVGEMVVRNNKLLISRYDGLVAAVDLGSAVRSVVWQERLPGLTTSTLRGDRFYVGGLNGDVYALDPDNGGRRVWRQITGAPVTTLTAGETTLYVAGSGGRVTALDNQTGGILWFDRLGSALASAPIVFENAIYFTTGLKGIYSYRVK